MTVGPILPALPARHNVSADPLVQRLDEVRPLLLMRRWFVIASWTVALGMFLRVLPGSPAIVTVLSLMALLLFSEKRLVERAASPGELDRWLTVFAAANVLVSTVLLHLTSDALWLPIIAYAVNIVASGTALRQRALVGVTALASLSFAAYAALATSGTIHPLTVFGSELAHELSPVGAGGSIGIAVGVVFFVSGFALPALAALSYGMTARVRATRDDLQAANADLDTAYGEVVEARRALDRWNAQLNDEVMSKTLALEEQNRFLTAINAISSALNATIEDTESPMRLGQLIARLLNLDAVQFYATLEPGEAPMNMVVSASGDIAHAVAVVDAALLRAVADGGDPIFEAPDNDLPAHESGALALAVVPLASRDRPLGALALVGARPRGWNDDERRLIRLVGREVGVSFENSRLYRAAVGARVRETALSNALNTLARDADRAHALSQALQLASDALGAVYVGLVSVAPGDRTVLVDVAQDEDWIDRGELARASAAAASLSIDRGHAMLLGPRGEAPVSAQMLGRGIGSVVLAPVLATRVGDHAAQDGTARSGHAYEVVGTLVALAAVGTPWGAAEAEIFERVAAGVARRLESDALVEVQRRRIRELSGLAQLVTRMQATINPEHLYHGFAVAMAGLLDSTDLYLVLLPEDRSAPVLRHYGADGTALSTFALQGSGHSWAQIEQATSWALPHAAAPPFLPQGARWAIGAPLRARGQPLGFMVAATSSRPDAEVVAIAGQASEQLALALDSALLYRQASDRAARIQVLGQLARIVASAADLREAFGVFAEEVRWLVSFDRALMMLVNETEGAFEVYAAYPGAPHSDDPRPVHGSIALAALDSDQPASFSRLDPAWAAADWSLFGDDADEVAMVRVVAGDGATALFALTRCAPQPFDAADLGTLEEVSSLLAVTLERVKLFEDAEYHANHDALTGLPNLRTLNQAAPDYDRSIAAGLEVAVLVIDMDDLKVQNDTFGHARGDEAIRAVAREIALNCRMSDLVVRSGGDEFVMVMRDADIVAAQDVATRVHTGLVRSAEELEWAPNSLGVSVGVAVSSAHGNDLRSLLRAADQAMYDAKLAGGGRTRVAGDGAPVGLGAANRRRGERVLEDLLATALQPASAREAALLARAQESAAHAARGCGLGAEVLPALRFLVSADAAPRLLAGPGLPVVALEALAAAVARGAHDLVPGDFGSLRDFASAAVEIAWGLDPAQGTSDYASAARSAGLALAPHAQQALLEAFRRVAASGEPEVRAA